MKCYGFICLFIFQQLIAGTLSTGAYSDLSRLVDRIFRRGYKSYLIPARNDAAPVNMTLGMTLLNMDPEKNAGELYLNVWLSQEWTDFRLQWDPDKFDGITQFPIHFSSVWTPDMSLYNSAGPVDMIPPSNERNVVVFNSGRVVFVRHVALRSNCDVRRTTTCVLKIGSWVHSTKKLDVTIKTNKIDLGFYSTNPNWEITKTTVKRNEQHYDCCPESYVDISFEIQLRKV